MFGLFLSSFFLINVFLKSFPSLPLSLTLVLPHSLIISCPYSFPSFFFLILSFYLILSPSISSSHSLAVSHLTSFPLSYHHSSSQSFITSHSHSYSVISILVPLFSILATFCYRVWRDLSYFHADSVIYVTLVTVSLESHSFLSTLFLLCVETT